MLPLKRTVVFCGLPSSRQVNAGARRLRRHKAPSGAVGAASHWLRFKEVASDKVLVVCPGKLNEIALQFEPNSLL